MIGRGTRLCPGLIDGLDKDKFYIFDFCGNFEFFRMNKGKPTANLIALQGAIFGLQFEITYKLQDLQYQTERLIAYRKALVEHMTSKVQEPPFTDQGSIVEVFTDLTVWMGIRRVIEQVNANALAV